MAGPKYDDAKLDALTPEHKDRILKTRAYEVERRQAERRLRDAGDVQALKRAARRNEQHKAYVRRRSSKGAGAIVPSHIALQAKTLQQPTRAAAASTTELRDLEQTITPLRRRLRKRSSLSPERLSWLRDPSEPASNDSNHGEDSTLLPTPSITTQPGSPEPRLTLQPPGQVAPTPQPLSARQLVKKKRAVPSVPVIELSDDDVDAKPIVKMEVLNSGSQAAGLSVEPLRRIQAPTSNGSIRNQPVSSPASATEPPVVDRAASVKCEIMKLRMNLVAAERQEAEKAREQAALKLEYYQMQMQ
ncbi:hypothetical protein LTR10_015961 [Elasticomyces elasticus]|nr:hypothetical protein LTR10_015961 [Elasticomyces elasticus]KAK4974586.1 hypothetical protein LTR42_005231 [Elasticomyces elasticus]